MVFISLSYCGFGVENYPEFIFGYALKICVYTNRCLGQLTTVLHVEREHINVNIVALRLKSE